MSIFRFFGANYSPPKVAQLFHYFGLNPPAISKKPKHKSSGTKHLERETPLKTINIWGHGTMYYNKNAKILTTLDFKESKLINVRV